MGRTADLFEQKRQKQQERPFESKTTGGGKAPAGVSRTQSMIQMKKGQAQNQQENAVKLPADKDELMRLRQQAQIDLDVDTVSRIDNQLKAMRAAEGKQTVRDRVGDATGAATAGYLGNVSNALGTVAESMGAKNFAQKAKGLADIAGEDTERFTRNAKEGLGAMGQFAVDAGIMGGQMAIDAAAGMLVPFGGMAAMGTRTFGGGAKAARDAGATQGQQLAYGAGSAALAILTEKIANVSGLFKGTYGKGLLDKVMNKVTAKPGGKLILSALSEGGEEMLESALDPILQKITYNPDAAYDEEWLAETLYSGALGAVLGGFGGSVDVVTGRGKTSAEAAEDAGANGGTGKEYVGDMPRNVEKPHITSPNLSASNYLENGETIETAYGNKHRKTVEQNAEKRLGIGPNRPAYLVASNVTKNGEIYYAKITRESLGKMLYTEKNQRLPVERLVLVDNLEKAFDESVWASSEGDRKNRPQINGFDRLRTSFYIDGKPYYADIVVKVVQQGKEADSENVVYFLEPESIEVIKKVDPQSPTLERHAPKIFFGDSVSTTKTVSQEEPTVKNPYDIMPKLEKESTPRFNGSSANGGARWGDASFEANVAQEQQTVKDPNDIMPKLTATNIPVKAQETLKRTENALLRKIGRALSVPVGVQRSDLKGLVRSISNEYLRDGKVSQESLDTLFEEAYERGIETDTEYYDQHRGLKDTLRNTAITISAEDAANITDFNAFRKAAMGTLKIANNGTPVDVVYARLSEQDPALFPATIMHPADQLQRMFEVGKGIQKVERTLNDYYGEDAATFKAWAKRDFNDAVNGALAELGSVRRFSEEAARKQAAKMTGSPEQVKAAYDNIRNARKKKERAVAKNLLTDSDNAQVSRLLKGEIQLKDINPKTNNVRGIKEVYEAKLEYEQLARVIREYKKNHSQNLRDEAEVLLKNSVNWKDKKAGMLYSRETMERNIRDIVPDKEVADRIIRKYFTPVHASQAASTRAKNDYRNRVKKLGLSRSVAKGNEVSEAHAVQLLGEAEDNIRVLENSTEKNPMRDGQTLQEWRITVEKLKNNNPNMDWEKVNNAVNEFRAIYDELFQKMNEVRLRNGYEPVAYRQGYFPHFQPGETGLLASFGAALGITTDVTDLPTSINGMTHTFKPGITWFGHAQERKGFNTAYDAVQGFDKYIEGAADVIYQTDNIQNLRALANQIRYRAGDEGLKKQIDEINANENLTEDQKQAAVEQTHKEGGFALSNFVVELEEYTNLLANKKSRADRNMEQAMGRRMYNIIKGLEGRVAANMVAINPGSWLTNFIPITQGMAGLNSKALLKGMWDTMKAYKVDDGMVDMSTFLTNRRGSDPLVKTWAQDWSAKASKPMEWIDSFTADTLVRGRFNQNISEGMSVNEALDEADAWAAKVMADRSKGATPTLFNRHNPFTKVFTQFQLEVNNQMSYLFKDVPDEMREKGLKALAVALMKMFVGAYLYNEVYEHFVGRRPAMDPIGILIETGKNLSNEDMDAYDVLVATGTEVAENLPFVGGLLGGGRLPISSALPNMENLGKAVFSDDWDEKKKRATIAKELTAPATYLLSPFGGGQIKKAWQGAKAVKQGGSYTVNSKGEDVLQYPILSDNAAGKAKDYAQAMIFGKSSLPEAKDWVQKGFNSLSGPETATYQELVKAGENGRESFDILQELGDVEKTETESKAYLQRKALRDADLTDEGRSILFYNLLAGDKEQELMDGASQKDREKAGDLLMNMKDAELHKGDTAKKAKYYALTQSDVSDEMKIAVYNKYVTDSKEEEIRNMLDQGVKFNDWLQFEAKTGNLSSDDDATKKEKVIGALRDLNLSEDKKAAMYFASAATDSDKEKQQELEASSGITRTQYWQYQEATAGMSQKAEKLVAIDSLDLTPEQKTALYFANRWAESTLDEAPWYGNRWDITPKLTGTTQKNPFLAAPKLTGAPVLQKQNPFLKMPTL